MISPSPAFCSLFGSRDTDWSMASVGSNPRLPLYLPTADDEEDTTSPSCLLQPLYCRHVLCPVDVYVDVSQCCLYTGRASLMQELK